MAKSVVTYEAVASDSTAVWRVVHLRPSVKPREFPDRVPPAVWETEKIRRSVELRRITLKSTQGKHWMGAPEGNLNSPPTGYSAVPNGWGQNLLPPACLVSPNLNNLNSIHGPELEKPCPQLNVTGVLWDDNNVHCEDDNMSSDNESDQDDDFSDTEVPLSEAYRVKDLDVLKVDTPTDLLKPINVGLSSAIRVGQQCLAIGNPFGFDHTLTVEFTIKDKYFCPALAQAVKTMNIEQMEQTKVKANLCEDTPMVYFLKPVIEEIQRSAEESDDRRIAKMCLGMLRAMSSHHENNYVAYRKGIGVVCNKRGGNSFGSFNTAVAYPTQSAGKNTNDGENVTRTKRAEMERNVPKPLTKELQERNLGHKCKHYQQVNLMTGVSEEVVPDQGKVLGKNLSVLRFSNLGFEPLWSRQYIRDVPLIFSEGFSTEGRGGYFDSYSIIRDIRNEKPLQLDDVVIVQPKIHTKGDTTYPVYTDDKTVLKDSLTPTFASINNARWNGVSFLKKSGKALPTKRVELRVQFRHVPGNLYKGSSGTDLDRATNELVICVQPEDFNTAWSLLRDADGFLVPGGFGYRHVKGKNEFGRRMEIIEIPDLRFFVGVQFQPEFESRPSKPSAPLVGLRAAPSGQLDPVLQDSCNGHTIAAEHPLSNGSLKPLIYLNGHAKKHVNGVENGTYYYYANGNGVHGYCFLGLLAEVEWMFQMGCPVLVGTTSVESSENVLNLLKARNIPHNVLNARPKYAAREAGLVVVAQAIAERTDNAPKRHEQTVPEISEYFPFWQLKCENSNDPDPWVRIVHQQKGIKRKLMVDVEHFNRDKRKGFEYLQGVHLLPEGLDPHSVTLVIGYTPGLDKNLLGDYLGNHDEFSIQVFHELVKTIDFREMNLNAALRFFLETFGLPGKSQKIQRILGVFSEMSYSRWVVLIWKSKRTSSYIACDSNPFLDHDMFELIKTKFPGAPKYLLYVLAERKNSDVYGPRKWKCLAEFGIITQCVALTRVNDQYITNVLLKINAELGGINSLLQIETPPSIPLVSKVPTIILEMDVFHGSPEQFDVPPFAAAVGSREWLLISKYRASVRSQSPKLEMMDSLFKPQGTGGDGLVWKLLIDFYTSSGKRKPDQIINFRDGISESQLTQVLNIELDQIIEACKFLEEIGLSSSHCWLHRKIILPKFSSLVHTLYYAYQRNTTAISVIAPSCYVHLSKEHSQSLILRLLGPGFLMKILEDKYCLEGKELSDSANI